jgi:serine/threonine-protein kinase HipA
MKNKGIDNLERCPGCFRPGSNSYCSRCVKILFNGRRTSHVLSFTRPEFNRTKLEGSGSLSISGIQIKHSLMLADKELILTERQGEYILKPVPGGQFENLDQVPANEHLTMQIAKQVFNINTAENALIFFSDGEPAYITRRFDVVKPGEKLLQEDFAQIAGKTEEINGNNYKYDFSYEEIGELIKKHVKANPIEIEKYFKIIIFNYLFSNGDSHLKNFSLYRNIEYEDYLLTPFYDLLNTSLHVPGDSDMALELFKDGFITESYKPGSKHTRADFYEFAGRIGIRENRLNKLYNSMLDKSEEVEEFVKISFLCNDLRDKYLEGYFNKLSRLRN